MQGFSIKAFSLLELVVTLLVLSILILFIVPKIQNILERNSLETLKSDLSLIQYGVLKQKNKNSFLQKDIEINSLDSARVNMQNERLFDKILENSLKSTTSSEKKSGYWAKLSNSEYVFYTKDLEFRFSLKNSFFECVSSLEVCKKLEIFERLE